MTSKEKILTVAASLALALGLVLLLFVQLGTASEQASPRLTAVASPISEAISDENCDKPCWDKGTKVITTPKGGIQVGQNEGGKEQSFVPMNSRQTMTETTDFAAPIVHQLVISDGVATTSEQAVTLDLSVTDPPPEPISGVSVVYFIEYEYVLSNGSWVPVSNSDWVDYTEGGLQDYPWSLTPTYGVRYMRVWAKDQASNISRDSSIGIINLLPSEQAATLSLGDVNFYRIYVEAGQTLTATLIPVSGDPDLYIWGPSGGAWYTNSPTEVESLAVLAPDAGTYQIEVHGYTEAEYKLNFGTSHDRIADLPGIHSKPPPREPTLPLDNLPDSSAPPSNNLTPTPTANLTATAIPWRADLLVSHENDEPDPVTLGEPLTYTIEVTNSGPYTATNVYLWDDLPTDAELISVSAKPQGDCDYYPDSNDSEVTCNLGDLGALEGVTMTLIVEAQLAGEISNTVNVSNAVPDPNMANNSSEERTIVDDNGLNMTSVMPRSGWNDEEVELELQGYGFREPLTVTLGSTALTVTEVLSDRILAIVPRGLELGWYDITVDSPSYGSVSLSNAYEVLDREGKSYRVYLPITIR